MTIITIYLDKHYQVLRSWAQHKRFLPPGLCLLLALVHPPRQFCIGLELEVLTTTNHTGQLKDRQHTFHRATKDSQIPTKSGAVNTGARRRENKNMQRVKIRHKRNFFYQGKHSQPRQNSKHSSRHQELKKHRDGINCTFVSVSFSAGEMKTQPREGYNFMERNDNVGKTQKKRPLHHTTKNKKP
ncbi:hypothetical protein ACSS6W_002665 [Trichoderma asperelloides]